MRTFANLTFYLLMAAAMGVGYLSFKIHRAGLKIEEHIRKIPPPVQNGWDQKGWDGCLLTYHRSGPPARKECRQGGLLHGVESPALTVYSEDGTVVREEWYYRGTRLGGPR